MTDSGGEGRYCINEALGMDTRDSYRFADYGTVLGVDLYAVRIHFPLVQLEEMTGLVLVVPRLACTSFN
jgi:hypothetical protein